MKYQKTHNGSLIFIEKAINIIAVFGIFLSCASFILSTLKSNLLPSLFFYMGFVSCAAWFTLEFIYYAIVLANRKAISNITPLKKYFISLLIVFLIILCSFVNILINSRTFIINLGYYKKFFAFAFYAIYSHLIVTFKLNKKANLIVTMIIEATILITVFLFVIGVTRSWGGSRRFVYLNLNLANPNVAAEFLLVLLVYSFYISTFIKNNFFKSLQFIITIVLAIMMLLTSSRNVIISIFVAVIFITFLLIAKKKKIPINNYLLIFMIAIMPLLFMCIYNSVISNEKFQRLLGFFNSDIKDFYSRYYDWSISIKQFVSNPFFGSYSQLNNGEVYQLLNSSLDVLTVFGMFPFVLYLFQVTLLFFEILNNGKVNKQELSLLAMMCIYFMGFCESGLITGTNGLYILGLSIFSFATNKHNENVLYKTKTKISNLWVEFTYNEDYIYSSYYIGKDNSYFSLIKIEDIDMEFLKIMDCPNLAKLKITDFQSKFYKSINNGSCYFQELNI